MIAYLALAAALGMAASFGVGWHYGGKGAAVSLAQAQVVNQQLAGQVDATKADCARAVAALQADVERRKRAAKAAQDAADKASAEERAAVNRLALRAQTAVDGESNCANAREILNQLALDKS